MNFDEIFDWLKSFEREQNQIPAWIYNLLEVLLKYKNQCEVSTDKYREFPDYETVTMSLSDLHMQPSNFGCIMRPHPSFHQISWPLVTLSCASIQRSGECIHLNKGVSIS